MTYLHKVYATGNALRQSIVHCQMRPFRAKYTPRYTHACWMLVCARVCTGEITPRIDFFTHSFAITSQHSASADYFRARPWWRALQRRTRIHLLQYGERIMCLSPMCTHCSYNKAHTRTRVCVAEHSRFVYNSASMQTCSRVCGNDRRGRAAAEPISPSLRPSFLADSVEPHDDTPLPHLAP